MKQLLFTLQTIALSALAFLVFQTALELLWMLPLSLTMLLAMAVKYWYISLIFVLTGLGSLALERVLDEKEGYTRSQNKTPEHQH
jgi:hypothetical protein